MKKLYPEESVQAIADAIRSKTGKTDKMTIGEMSGEVEGIEKGWSANDIALRLISGEISCNATTIAAYSFYLCEKITSFDFPNAVTMYGSAAYGCTRLTSVHCPVLGSVGNSGFALCTKISSLDFNLLNTINNYALYRCSSLTTLILRNSSIATLANINALTSTPIASGTGYIYVPSALIDSYKTATNWTMYASQFRALEDYTVDGTTTGELDESKI